MSSEHPTILASDHMHNLFVRAEAPALDRHAATAALVAEASTQWGLEINPELLPNPVAVWYKETCGLLAPCRASDPAAHSRWWVFSGVPPQALTPRRAA